MVSKVTLSVVIFICAAFSVSARRIYEDLETAASDKVRIYEDLEVAASDKGKEEWQKKGGGNDHHKNEGTYI